MDPTDEKRISEALARLRRYAPCELGAPEAFSDERAPASYFDWWPRHIRGRKGRTSEAVTRRIVANRKAATRRGRGQLVAARDLWTAGGSLHIAAAADAEDMGPRGHDGRVAVRLDGTGVFMANARPGSKDHQGAGI